MAAEKAHDTKGDKVKKSICLKISKQKNMTLQLNLDKEHYRPQLSQPINKQVRTLKMLYFQKHFSTHKGPCFSDSTNSAKLSDVTRQGTRLEPHLLLITPSLRSHGNN